MDFFLTLFVLIFVGVILYQIVEFLKNESAPEVSVPAKLVDKSMRSSSSIDANGIANESITYSLFFELEHGERKEFIVSHGKYKLYVVGDAGVLRFQRKRFNALDRYV